MKKIFCFILNLSLSLFSFIVPKKNNLILFGSGGGNQYKGNPKTLFEYIIRNKKKFKQFNIFWITRNEGIFTSLIKNKLPLIKINSIKGYFTILQSKYIIIDQSTKDFSYFGSLIGNFNIIQTWHGTPLKKIGLDSDSKKKNFQEKIFNKLLKKEFKHYKFILSASKEVSKSLNTAFNNENTQVLGYPRNDILLNKMFCQNSLKTKLHLNKYSKIISYVPTFRDVETDQKPFSEKGLTNLNKLLKKQNSLLILKKHPFDKNFQKFKNLSNIKDFSKEVDDIQELLIHTDILITDYSSVCFDFCLTNKPIIYYPYDFKKYLETCRGMYYDYFKEIPGPFAKNEIHLFELIQSVNAWFNKKTYQSKYKKFKDKFNKYQDGKSCERVINAIVGLK